jgi:predicted small secreted protein
MIKYKRNAAAVLAIGMLALTLSACQKEGPAEKAGKEVDNTMSKAGEQIEKAGDKIQDTAKDAQK